ncbi:interleukin-1 receptor-like 1 isoform X1 [Rhineura floridana]|uniref:interleukin-1 receptor-like 1 isoform X1 n=1 Tax=Rhineura floridana TaxID=261503 RepID=UPI002AC85579|nr:interleukin-1 receptor-like 1 isoform X1 [Rhineura floridana]
MEPANSLHFALFSCNTMALLYFILFMAFLPVSEMQTFGITIEGEAFVVRCPNANDSEAVNWQFGDTSVSIDPTARVHSSGSKLWFLPASPEDTGDYTCVRYQYYPQVTKTVKVRVHPRVEGICYYKDALDIQARGSRGSGRIVCAPYRDYYNASDMKWYKDCQLLYGSRYKIANKFLYISDANENDNGYYTCEFTYSHDGKKFTVSATRAFKIVELSSPRPIEVLSPIDDKEEVEIGASKTLLCKAWLGLGKQILALSRWEHEGENDSNRFVTSNRSDVISGKGQFTEATLEIKKVRKEDLGTTFTCILANDRGYKKVNVTLVAKGTVKGHSNTYVIVVFVILMVVIMILVMVYRFFRVDIVLWYRRVFNCTGSKDDSTRDFRKSMRI